MKDWIFKQLYFFFYYLTSDWDSNWIWNIAFWFRDRIPLGYLWLDKRSLGSYAQKLQNVSEAEAHQIICKYPWLLKTLLQVEQDRDTAVIPEFEKEKH